jgi:Glycosyl hydrolases family 8
MRRSSARLCFSAAALAVPLAVACATSPSGIDNPGGGGSSSGSGGNGSSGSNGGGSNGGGSNGGGNGSSGGRSSSGGGGSNGGGSNGGGSNGGSGSSGAGGSSGVSSGSSGTGGSGSSSGVSSSGIIDAGMSMCGTPGMNVLSDFEQNTGILVQQKGRTGWWYVFSDGAGSQTPAANATGPIAVAAAPSDDKTLTGETCNKFALSSTASGHNTLGPSSYVGVGATFVPLAGSNKSAYDLSTYDGIQFDIKTTDSNQGPVYFELLTKESQPASLGGTASTNGSVDLNNNRGFVLSATGTTPTGTSTAIPTTMTTVFVPFSLLVPRYFPQPGPSGCGNTKPCQSPAFVPTSALGFQFSTYPDFSSTGSYNLWIDNVALYNLTSANEGLVPPGFSMPAFKDGPSSGWSCAKPTFPGSGKPAAGKYLLWAYRNWQTNYVRQAGSTTTPCTTSSNQCIVMSPEVQNPSMTPGGGSVVSEGIAYGMLISAYMGDQTLFDRLWNYWIANPATGHLMTWIFGQNGTGSKGSGSATDADEDVAMALYVASKVMPSNQATYLSNAVAVINDIWTNDFDHTTNLPTEGSNLHTSEPTNPSYFAPAYHPIFAAQSGVAAAAVTGFGAATTAEYAALNRISASTLPPAWCSGTCGTAGGGGFANATAYQYDAHRVPWRIGVDFCWNGSSAASGYLSHITSYFAGQAANGIDSLLDEYTTGSPPGTCTSCTPTAQPNSMSLIGTAAVGALASGSANSAFINAAWQFVLDGINRGTPNIMMTGNNYYTYFNSTVGLLTALTLSGNFYKL